MIPPPDDFILLGYECRETMRPPVNGGPVPGVALQSIASVSRCLSQPYQKNTRPFDWPRMNQLMLYLQPAQAWQAIPDNLRPQFDLYAYAVRPVTWDNGAAVPLTIDIALPPQPLAAGYEFLGYDAVSSTPDLNAPGVGIECSPLSCNGMGKEIPVNAWCMVDDLEAARRLAQDWSRDEAVVEPGVYHVFAVWRQVRTTE